MNNKHHVIVDRFLMLMHTISDVAFVKGANEENKQERQIVATYARLTPSCYGKIQL